MTFALRTILLAASLLAAAAGHGRAGNDFPPLAASFRETSSNGHTAPRSFEWYLTREANRVEIGRGGYVEVWERDDRGAVSWRRVFHDYRKVITYTPAELDAQGRALPWETVNSVIDARQLLEQLKPVEKTRFLDRAATRYAGQVGNIEVEVVWLETEQLPGRVVRRDRMHVYYLLMLQELRSEPALGWPRSDPARAEAYEHIDGADLGDREYDPFVQKVLAVDGHGQGHAH